MTMLMIFQSFDVRSATGIRKHCYGGKCHFDENFIQIVKDLKNVNILKFDPESDFW